jgi:hypothetical protein
MQVSRKTEKSGPVRIKIGKIIISRFEVKARKKKADQSAQIIRKQEFKYPDG